MLREMNQFNPGDKAQNRPGNGGGIVKIIAGPEVRKGNGYYWVEKANEDLITINEVNLSHIPKVVFSDEQIAVVYEILKTLGAMTLHTDLAGILRRDHSEVQA